MRNRFLCITGLLYVASLLVHPGVHVWADQTEERFRAEAPKAWRDFERAAENIDVTGHYDSKWYQLDRSQRPFLEKESGKWRFIRLGRSFCVEVSDAPRESKGVTKDVSAVICRSPRYEFQLEKSTSKSDWLLSSLSPPRASFDPFDPQEPFRMRFAARDVVFGPSTFLHESLSALLVAPNFKLTKATTISRTDGSAVEVQFQIRQPTSAERADRRFVKVGFNEGRVVMLPEKQWCIVDCDLVRKDDAGAVQTQWLVHRELEKFGAFYFPSRTEIKFLFPDPLNKDGPLIGSDVVTLDVVETVSFGTAKEQQFMLTAFGLPEPPGMTPKRTPIYVWVLGLGVIAVIVGLFLRRSRSSAN